jgi:hypothetical protein
MGLQRKDSKTVSSELNLPLSQVLAFFNKAIRKFSDYFDRICASAIEDAMHDDHKNVEKATASLKPTAVSLEDEIKSGEQEIRERQKRDKESLFSELGISDMVNGNNNGQLSQFAIKATDDEWAGTLRSLKLSNAKPIGIVSVKAPKRQVLFSILFEFNSSFIFSPAEDKKSVTIDDDLPETSSKTKRPKTDFKKAAKKKGGKR